MPKIYSFNQKKGTGTLEQAHPIYDFVQKYKDLKKKGYSEYKAFSIVEEELRLVIDN